MVNGLPLIMIDCVVKSLDFSMNLVWPRAELTLGMMPPTPSRTSKTALF